MSNSSLELSFLSVVTLTTFFIFLMSSKFLSNLKNEVLIDNDFIKPQAFHLSNTPRLGGLCSFLSFTIFLIFNYFLFNDFYLNYFLLGTGIFIIGFLDDLKVNFSPNKRLIMMIIWLIFCESFFPQNLNQIDLIFLNDWLQNEIFFSVFIILCFLFIINGSNLIDGFNGLASIHFIIINSILLILNLNNSHIEISMMIVSQLIILVVFALFNFPKSKMFLGDSGAYFHGSITALNTIVTNNLNSEISSFFFCVLLFYLFFEVFFSFFRKLLKKQSPLKPDSNHLHMLVYKFYKSKDIEFANPLTGFSINLAYFTLIIPSFLMRHDGLFCKAWFFNIIFIYLISYYFLKKFDKI